MKENKVKDNEIDWYAIIIPLVGVIIISILFLTFPDKSMQMIQVVRAFLGNQCGIYYAVLGLGIFFCSIYMAFSDFGKILLGKSGEKKRYSSLRWGMMIFTSTMAADILFYRRAGRNTEVGIDLSVVSLGADCVEHVYCISGSVRIYASCKRKKSSEIF